MTPLKCLGRLVFLISLFALSAVASKADGLRFQAQGRLTYDATLPDGTKKSWTRDFTATVDGCDWLIETLDSSAGEYSFKLRKDGLIYNVTRVNKTGNSALNNYATVIESNDVPGPDVTGASVIWLAYASRCYLESVTGNKYKPIWMLDDPSLREEGFAVNGLLSSLDSHLPGELVYLNDGIIRFRAPDGRRAFIRAPASFTGTVTNAVYRVLSVTNIGALTLPATFEFQRSGIDPDFTTHPLEKVSGALKSVDLKVRLNQVLPELKGTIYVQDRRFANAKTNIDSFSYRTTNLYALASTNTAFLKEKRIAELNQAANVQDGGKKGGH